MARYTCALCFLLVLFSLVNIEARESKFFTKAVVLHANNTTKNVTHHVDPPSPSPSPAPVEAQIISGSYGLYGRDEIPSTSGINSDTLFENKIPNEEFDEKFGKDEFDNNDLPSNYNEQSYVTVPRGDNKDKFDNEEFGNNRLPNNYNERSSVTVPQGDNKERSNEFSNNGLPSNYNQNSYVTVSQGDNKDKFANEELSNNGLPSNYNENSYVTVPEGDNKDKFVNEGSSNNGLPSNYNEHSYVTVPQGTNLYDTKFTPTATNNENEFPNNEEKLNPEEEKLFDENSNNNELNDNFNEPQKFSESPKFAEMDKYFNDNHNTYNVKEPQGMSDTRTLENGKYQYYAGSPQKYNSEGYNGKNGEPKSKYEFDTMEEFERQEGYSQIPGEYINP